MSVELLFGMTNVVRFPVERRARPRLELLRGIAPDVSEVLNVAEAFGMERPVPDLRERADVATAEHIANQIPAAGAERERLLGEMLDPIIAATIASCRAAHDAWLEAAAAGRAFPGRSARGARRRWPGARPSVCWSRICGPRRPRAWREQSAWPGAARPGSRATCAGRPRSFSALRPAPPDLLQPRSGSSSLPGGAGLLAARRPRLWPFDTGARWRSTSLSGPRARRSTGRVRRTEDEARGGRSLRAMSVQLWNAGGAGPRRR